MAAARDWIDYRRLRLDRVGRLLLAEVQGAAGDLRYYPSDRWRSDARDRKDFMRRAFQALVYNGIDGDYAEFGCYGATTFTLAWGASRLVGHQAHLWGFDSFAGLPATADPRDVHAGWVEGEMHTDEGRFVDLCLSRGLPRQDFTTVPGFYADSLRPTAPGPRPDRIAFAFVDCDLYTSTVDVLRFLGPRLRHGMILAFDDYFCSGTESPSGERLAAGEFFAANPDWQLVPYIQWGWNGMSFMVERAG